MTQIKTSEEIREILNQLEQETENKDTDELSLINAHNKYENYLEKLWHPADDVILKEEMQKIIKGNIDIEKQFCEGNHILNRVRGFQTMTKKEAILLLLNTKKKANIVEIWAYLTILKGQLKIR